MAPWLVAVVALTGVFLAAGTIRSPAALWSSEYGRLLLLKLGLATLLLLAGNAARLVVRRRYVLASREPAGERLGKVLGVELSAAIGVLAVTAVLVSTSPPADRPAAKAVAAAVRAR
jgi:copper transport protein